MAKKKKTQLKPVARGFATTSQPKKVVVVEDDRVDVGGTSGIAERASTPDSSKISDGNGAGETKTKDESDTGKSEENLLQGIVEKLQDKTEKEVRSSSISFGTQWLMSSSGVENGEGDVLATSTSVSYLIPESPDYRSRTTILAIPSPFRAIARPPRHYFAPGH
jgi:hypothetical protein